MKFVATLKKRTRLHIKWRFFNREERGYQGNTFKLINGIYTCTKVENLIPLLNNHNFVVESFGTSPITLKTVPITWSDTIERCI